MPPPPIRIPCEGSRHPVHFHAMCAGICQMCGVTVTTWADTDKAVDHERNDILAMIDRGDFDGGCPHNV